MRLGDGPSLMRLRKFLNADKEKRENPAFFLQKMQGTCEHNQHIGSQMN
jgi:hypothetical protein